MDKNSWPSYLVGLDTPTHPIDLEIFNLIKAWFHWFSVKPNMTATSKLLTLNFYKVNTGNIDI